MRIGIYNEPAGETLGGAEYLVAVLAHGLSLRHTVEIVHHHHDLTRDRLESFSGLDLSRVGLRCAEKTAFHPSRSAMPWRIWHDNRRWRADLSSPYDVFVNVGHGMPPFCHAARGVSVVLFPTFKKHLEWPWNDPPNGWSDIRPRVRNAYYEWEWKKRLASYAAIVAISEFTRFWTTRYWGIESSVVYPPVGAHGTETEKANRIISVGRFATTGHRKRQLELVGAFAGLKDLRDRGWTYECIGAAGTSVGEQAYLREVQALAVGAGATVRANVSRPELAREYDSAKIFLHATGFGEPDDSPDLAEHFGISTVEAMAAGCIPVVIAKGAQPEIVEHGVSGFLWNTILELQQYVRWISENETARQQMAIKARQRARAFSQETFVTKMTALIELTSRDNLPHGR
jgi:glycosyltransferase involved in cell wall biosynthesis